VLDQFDRPPFCPREGGIHESLFQPKFTARQQVLAKGPQDTVQHARALPLLKAAMRALIWPVSRRKILPRRSGAQNPQHTVQHAACIAPASTTTVRPLPMFLFPLHKRPHILPLRVSQIGHASICTQSGTEAIGYSPWNIGEMGSRDVVNRK
jgi:hypothetical protein